MLIIELELCKLFVEYCNSCLMISLMRLSTLWSGDHSEHLTTVFFFLSSRSVVGLFSTAAEHHSAGDDCHGDDGDEDHSHSMTHVRTLETRARKLEEQVHDLTVSSHSVPFYFLSITNMVPLWVSSMHLFSNHSEHLHCRKGGSGLERSFRLKPLKFAGGWRNASTAYGILVEQCNNDALFHSVRDVRKSKWIPSVSIYLQKEQIRVPAVYAICQYARITSNTVNT